MSESDSWRFDVEDVEGEDGPSDDSGPTLSWRHRVLIVVLLGISVILTQSEIVNNWTGLDPSTYLGLGTLIGVIYCIVTHMIVGGRSES